MTSKTIPSNTIPSNKVPNDKGISSSENSIKVWSLFVRLFHWFLVICFAVAYISEDDFIFIHTWAGYIISLLLLMRIVWGLFGEKYARFSNFLYSPTTIKSFIKETFQFKAKRYLGHNPAGGLMILILLLSLLICVITGMAVYAVEDNSGPMANWLMVDSYFWREALEEIHEFMANFIVMLVVIHLLGVFAESFIHSENLIQSMLTGYKKREKK